MHPPPACTQYTDTNLAALGDMPRPAFGKADVSVAGRPIRIPLTELVKDDRFVDNMIAEHLKVVVT
jgi:hypothetical protein